MVGFVIGILLICSFGFFFLLGKTHEKQRQEDRYLADELVLRMAESTFPTEDYLD